MPNLKGVTRVTSLFKDTDTCISLALSILWKPFSYFDGKVKIDERIKHFSRQTFIHQYVLIFLFEMLKQRRFGVLKFEGDTAQWRRVRQPCSFQRSPLGQNTCIRSDTLLGIFCNVISLLSVLIHKHRYSDICQKFTLNLRLLHKFGVSLQSLFCGTLDKCTLIFVMYFIFIIWTL